MAEVTFREISTTEPDRELVSLKAKPQAAPKEIKLERVELSQNIQKFDDIAKKARRSMGPYDYNSVALGPKKPSGSSSMTATQLITSPVHNTVGKALGVDTRHEWNRDYDKVATIVDWAKEKSGKEDVEELVKWLTRASMSIPSISSSQRRIDQLYLYAKMQTK